MKRIFSRISSRINKHKLTFVAVVALCAVAVPAAAVVASSGPDRPTKVYSQGVAGFDHPTFNSFTNVPNIGNEENFFNGRYQNTAAYTDPMPQVKDGDVETLEVYVHNGADPSLNTAPGAPGVAHDTQVRVSLPTGTAKSQTATAYISSSNASPKVVNDTLDLSAANGGNFAVEYVPGSAHITGNYINTALPDSIVTSGATIGTDKLNGDVKGCFQQEVLVTLQVKIKMPQYKIQKTVHVNGQPGTWAKTASTKAGDDDKWLVTFTNNGETPLNAVDIIDQVPAGLTVVPGSVKVINGNFPNGETMPNTAIQNNGRMVHVNIGNYNPGINAFVEYDTTVDKPAANVCSAFTLTNKAYATPQGFGAIYDTATVTVAGNSCTTQPKTPIHTCDKFVVTAGDNRTVTVTDFAKTASNGATFKDAVIDWGDKALITTNNVVGQKHTYAADGNYTIVATLHFTVTGQTGDVTASGANCTQVKSFKSGTPVTPPTTPVAPNTPTTAAPTALVNTGPGQVFGLFAVVTAVSSIGYRLFLGRRLSQDS